VLQLGVSCYEYVPFWRRLVSPILVRPVREQLEHDRIIRLLQTKCRRRYEAGMNPGNEQNVPVGTGPNPLYPDLVLVSTERSRRLQVVVEVETGESVNHLEALAEWAHLSRVRAAFHLYVPSGMVDVARRLCEDNRIHVNEIWSYHMVGDEVRFTLVHRNREAAPSVPRVRPVKTVKTVKAVKTVKKPARVARPAARAKTAARRGKATKKAAKPARAQKRK
jgi:hypothetical protein